MRRRDLIAAIAAVPAVAAVPAPTAAMPQPAASDRRFIGWWRAMDRLENRVNDAPQETSEDQDRIDAMCARAGNLQNRILTTPSTTRIAAEVKLRTIIRYLGMSDAWCVEPARDVLTFVEGLP